MFCTRTQSDYFRMNNNIFDTETDENGKEKAKLSAIQMRVLSVLYSLAPFKTYRVKVRQSVLAEKCHCSTVTVKRAVETLLSKGYIRYTAREEKYAWDMKQLGTYTYILPPINSKGYFYVNRKSLELLNKVQTRVYLFLCKCSRKTMDCWNSFNDIAKKLKLQRNAVVKAVRELAELNVITRVHNHNKNGAFNDNTYIIEDVEINRNNDEFIEDFFSQSNTDEQPSEETTEKAKGCRFRTTAANQKKHNKNITRFSLQPFRAVVKWFSQICKGFFYVPYSDP